MTILKFKNNIIVNLDNGDILCENPDPIHLQPQQLKCLNYLYGHLDKYCSIDELMREAWGSETYADSTVTSTISRINSIISTNGIHIIENRSGIGYKLLKEQIEEIHTDPEGKKHSPISGNAQTLNTNYVERDEYLTTIKTKTYRDFMIKVLQKYYGEEYITKINGIFLPSFSIFPPNGAETRVGINDPITKLDEIICGEPNFKREFDATIQHHPYEEYPLYEGYNKVLGGTLRHPDRAGYMLDKLEVEEFNENDVNGEKRKIRRMKSTISTRIGTFGENVFSCHALEYEIFQAFKKFGKSLEKDMDLDSIWNELFDLLTERNRIHKVETIEKWEEKKSSGQLIQDIYDGSNRTSLLCVQMLVLVKSYSGNYYEVKMGKRSNNVAIWPGTYEFSPAGGFEVAVEAKDGNYDEETLNRNCSAVKAILREYMEEMFNDEKLGENGWGGVDELILHDPRITKIVDLIKEKKIIFQFLGCNARMLTLRFNINFALVIRDEVYSKNQFIGNEEYADGNVSGYDIRDIDSEKKHNIWEKIHGESSLIWELFKNSNLYKELLTETI